MNLQPSSVFSAISRSIDTFLSSPVRPMTNAAVGCIGSVPFARNQLVPHSNLSAFGPPTFAIETRALWQNSFEPPFFRPSRRACDRTPSIV